MANFNQYKLLYLIVIAFIYIEACTSSDINTKSVLSGVWGKHYKGNITLMSDTPEVFIFKSDSFYYSIRTSTNDLIDPNSAGTNGQFATGVYTFNDSIIFLKGHWTENDNSKAFYTKHTFIGKLERSYYYKFTDTNTLILNPWFDACAGIEDTSRFTHLRLMKGEQLILFRQ